MKKDPSRYSVIIEEIFRNHFQQGVREFGFERSEIEEVAANKGIVLPKNLGDLIYSFRYRTELPESIRKEAPEGGRANMIYLLKGCRR